VDDTTYHHGSHTNFQTVQRFTSAVTRNVGGKEAPDQTKRRGARMRNTHPFKLHEIKAKKGEITMKEQYKLILEGEHLKDVYKGLRTLKDTRTIQHINVQVRMQNRSCEL